MTPYQLAERWVGEKEIPGKNHNPFVLGMLRLDNKWVVEDETAWCSAFVNFIMWLLRQPRSKSLAARSWLLIGQEVPLADAAPGFDVVILKRGEGEQPGAEVLKASGHVGFYAGESRNPEHIMLLGGNQGNAVSVAPFSKARILGIRRCVSAF
jgi:uncharacterized protein (TIGR02594 family)